MNKVFWVAWREFSSTVFTKGFLIGVFMTPLMLVLVGGAVSLMKNFKGPRIEGQVALIDQSGLVTAGVEKRFDPEADKKEAEAKAKQIAEALEKSPAGQLTKDMPQAQMQQQFVAAAAAGGPNLTLQVLPGNADVEQEKEPVKVAEIKAKGDGQASGAPPRLALVVVPEAAVKPDANGKFGTFQAYFAQRLDGEVQDRIERRVQEAVVDARISNDAQAISAGLTPEKVRSLVDRPQPEAKTLTPEGEKKSLGELTMLIPMGFMILMMVSVMTSGTQLLTTTVEEKSSRVMEVLLSAASPMQLMVGKILGQMGAGLLILIAYSGLAVGSVAFLLKRMDLISTESIIYLIIFFFIAFFLIAATMAAIGSAVNDMREAQTLMTPVMLMIMAPWLVWFLIQRQPNSPLAVIMSFVPVMNPFVMVIRLSGSEPVPTWQIPVSIAVGLVSVVFASWAAAKVFRIGVLMYGKPPDIKTLIRWVRMA